MTVNVFFQNCTQRQFNTQALSAYLSQTGRLVTYDVHTISQYVMQGLPACTLTLEGGDDRLQLILSPSSSLPEERLRAVQEAISDLQPHLRTAESALQPNTPIVSAFEVGAFQFGGVETTVGETVYTLEITVADNEHPGAVKVLSFGLEKAEAYSLHELNPGKWGRNHVLQPLNVITDSPLYRDIRSRVGLSCPLHPGLRRENALIPGTLAVGRQDPAGPSLFDGPFR